jgi:hypothetical protein
LLPLLLLLLLLLKPILLLLLLLLLSFGQWRLQLQWGRQGQLCC